MGEASVTGTKHLVITADDFGRARSINRAVATACDWGLLTAVSLVAGGEAFDEAVGLVSRYPGLSVGLHVTLSDGPSVLPPSRIPDLVNSEGYFVRDPALAGLRYWRLRHRIAGQIEAEVEAQFNRLERAGIVLTHVDCHHHLHVHPVVFDIVARQAAQRNITWIRIPREPLSLVLKLHPFQPKAFSKWLAFGLLADRNLHVAHTHGLRGVNYVYGISGTGRIDEAYLLALLPFMEGAVNELYLHPDMASPSGREQMKAVTSRRVRDRLNGFGLSPVGFRELTHASARHIELVADSP